MTGRLEKSKRIRLEGYIYCVEHGEVHADTLDPYGEGRKTCWDNLYGERTKDMAHRTLFWGGRKGDWVDKEGQP